MSAHVNARGVPPPSALDGEHFDRCPYDGCVEVGAAHEQGGFDGHGEEYHDWSIFSADRRMGGCGRGGKSLPARSGMVQPPGGGQGRGHGQGHDSR
jgi:hypothetical protein